MNAPGPSSVLAQAEALLEAIDGAAALLDESGRVELANAAWSAPELLAALGRPGERLDAPTRRLGAAIHGAAELTTETETLLSGGALESRVILAFSMPDGARHLEVRLRRLGVPLAPRLLASVRDVTELHRVRSALGRSRTRLRAIVTGAPIVLLSTDPGGVLTLVEGVGAEQLSMRAEELVGRSIFEVFSHLPAMVRAFESALGGKHETTFVELGPRTLELRCAPMQDAEGRREGVVAVATDISERRRIERMKDEFVAVVSHELRTPLTSIRGSLGLLLGGLAGPLEDKASELLRIAQQNTQRLIGLINDILDLDKLEAGKLQFNVEPLDCASLVEAAINATAGMARERGVLLATGGLACGQTPGIRGDRERLIQVLTNLLSNAIKHSPPGAAVEIGAASPRKGWLRFSVLDRGPGVPPEARARLFRKFEQSQHGSRAAGGTGLGLAISKAIIDAHHGRISVSDRAGGGAEFYFELPADQADRAGVEVRARPRRGRGRTREIDLGSIPDPTRGSLEEQLLGLTRSAEDAVRDGKRPTLVDAAAKARILRDARRAELEDRGIDLGPLVAALADLGRDANDPGAAGRALACIDALRRAGAGAG